MASTTDTWTKLAQPEKYAADMVSEISYPEITEGTEKQIKFAKDLRDNWLADVTHRDNAARVRWAVIKQTRNERLSDMDIRDLAHDAWNRRLSSILNTTNAKTIIDALASSNIEGEKKRLDAISRYKHIIRFPAKWNFDGKKWVRIDWK